MAGITNGSFETEGALVGDALGWIYQTVAGYELVALFTLGAQDNETFEAGWSNDVYQFAFNQLIDVVPPLFDTTVGEGETFEDFEEGWSSNQGYSFAMGAALAASFDSAIAAQDFEDFEQGWSSNELYAFAMGAVVAASFDSALTPESFEDFEEGWRSNETYATVMGATTTAAFDSGGQLFEDFEQAALPIAVSADPSTSKFTAVAHGLTNGTKVQLETTGAVPLGLSTESFYYVITATTNDFQLSATVGGSAVSFSSLGSGDLSVVRDRALYWVTFLT